jgi:hypothetical protein
MKRTIRIFMVLVVVALALPSLNSCKKGENDPFLSLKSRDSRITGEWKLTKAERTVIEPNFGGSGNVTTVVTFNGTTKTTTSTGQTTPTSINYSLNITLEKNGIAKIIEIAATTTSQATSTWFWLETAKSKMWININGSEYQVDQLKNKELVLIQKTETTITSGSTIRTTSDTETLTFEKQ